MQTWQEESFVFPHFIMFFWAFVFFLLLQHSLILPKSRVYHENIWVNASRQVHCIHIEAHIKASDLISSNYLPNIGQFTNFFELSEISSARWTWVQTITGGTS